MNEPNHYVSVAVDSYYTVTVPTTYTVAVPDPVVYYYVTPVEVRATRLPPIYDEFVWTVLFCFSSQLAKKNYSCSMYAPPFINENFEFFEFFDMPNSCWYV